MSDYAGGRASRRASPLVVTLIAEISIFAVLIVVVPLTSTSTPGGGDLAWGAAAGAAGTVGIIALYYALANGAMTVVAPITGVVSAVVPVAVGLATGERPSVLALVGVSIAILSVALIGGLVGIPHVRTPMSLVMVALLSGASFGLLFVFFDQAGDDSGMWPILGARLASGPMLVLAYFISRPQGGIDRKTTLVAALIGIFGSVGQLPLPAGDAARSADDRRRRRRHVPRQHGAPRDRARRRAHATATTDRVGDRGVGARARHDRSVTAADSASATVEAPDSPISTS